MQKIFSYSLLLLCLNNISQAYYDTKNNEYGLTKNSTFESFNTISETIIALDTTQNKIKTILQNSQNTKQSSSNKNSFQKKQTKSHLNKKEINEYKVFINYLSIQINDYCTKIYNSYGSDALLSLPCDNEINYSHVDSHVDNDNSSLTMNEQIESLDDELINSLGTFDEMLLKEEEIIALQNRKSQSSSGMENSDNDSGNSSNDKKGQIEEKRSGNNKELKEKKYSEKGKNSKASANKQSNGKQSKKKRNERRKLDEIDDDIVARQLKEAAEKEKDPALKKKLWDEYYKYKKKNIKS